LGVLGSGDDGSTPEGFVVHIKHLDFDTPFVQFDPLIIVLDHRRIGRRPASRGHLLLFEVDFSIHVFVAVSARPIDKGTRQNRPG
jgi:hypothetical protein